MKRLRSISLCIFTLVFYLFSSALFLAFGLSPVKTSVFAGVLSGIVCLCFYLNNKSQPVKPLKLTFGRVILCLLFFLVFWWVSQSVSMLIYYFTQDGAYDSYQQVITGDGVLYIVLTLFIAPITEELLLRGIWYRELSKVSVWASYVVSTLLFAYLHGTLVHIPATILSGLLFCIVYDYTGKLRYCVLLHALYNLISLIVPVFCRADVAYILFISCLYVELFALLVFAIIYKRKKLNILKTNKGHVE